MAASQVSPPPDRGRCPVARDWVCYPPASRFEPALSGSVYRAQAASTNDPLIPRALALVLHMPGAAGARRGSVDARQAEDLTALDAEIRLQAQLFDDDRSVDSLHLCADAASIPGSAGLQALMAGLRAGFTLETAEYRWFTVETALDGLTDELIERLGKIRLNGLILDLTDGGANEGAPAAAVAARAAAVRAAGFRSLWVMLSPHQLTPRTDSAHAWLQRLLELRPDRIVLDENSPDPQSEALDSAIERLAAASYHPTGLGRFSRNDTAAPPGGQHRAHTVIGLGPGAISQAASCHLQNHRTREAYRAALHAGHLPIERGIVLTAHDHARREILRSLTFSGECLFEPIEQRYGIGFSEHFADELRRAQALEREGLVSVGAEGIRVTSHGSICPTTIWQLFDPPKP